jgi:phosphomannomutase
VADGNVTRLTLPKSNVLAFELTSGSRIIARPSGTEPKIKFYFDVRALVGQEEAMKDAEARANATMADLSELFTKAAAPS